MQKNKKMKRRGKKTKTKIKKALVRAAVLGFVFSSILLMGMLIADLAFGQAEYKRIVLTHEELPPVALIVPADMPDFLNAPYEFTDFKAASEFDAFMVFSQPANRNAPGYFIGVVTTKNNDCYPYGFAQVEGTNVVRYFIYNNDTGIPQEVEEAEFFAFGEAAAVHAGRRWLEREQQKQQDDDGKQGTKLPI
jgi:hypothetical protein